MEKTAGNVAKNQGKGGKRTVPVQKHATALESEGPPSHLARTARRILAKAAHSLAKEPAPRKQGKEPATTIPQFGLDAGLEPEEIDQLVEITDDYDNTLAILAPGEALRQGLRFRMIAVILRTTRNTVLLSRAKDEKPNRPVPWSMGLDFVRVGEAREDAATRMLAKGFGLGGIRPRMAAVAENSAAFAYDLTLYVADLPVGLLPGAARFEILAVDKDELEGLLKRTPGLFSEELRWAFATGKLFYS